MLSKRRGIMVVLIIFAACAIGVLLIRPGIQRRVDDNARGVSKGMTFDQVTRLLGNPAEKVDLPLANDQQDAFWAKWVGDVSLVKVFFNANSVASRSELTVWGRNDKPTWKDMFRLSLGF